MAISYNKLWKLLVDKKMSKADLRKAACIAPNTMTRLRRDEEVTLSVLYKICRSLDLFSSYFRSFSLYRLIPRLRGGVLPWQVRSLALKERMKYSDTERIRRRYELRRRIIEVSR